MGLFSLVTAWLTRMVCGVAFVYLCLSANGLLILVVLFCIGSATLLGLGFGAFDLLTVWVLFIWLLVLLCTGWLVCWDW